MPKKIQNIIEVPVLLHENEEDPVRIPLTEKRFLDIAEFQAYTSLGRSRAAQLAREAGVTLRYGRRILIDRVRFDKWCDQQ